jgi:hypothetical protein
MNENDSGNGNFLDRDPYEYDRAPTDLAVGKQGSTDSKIKIKPKGKSKLGHSNR